MSRDEIFESVRDVLEDALGVDRDEITMDASLTGDLGAESIDFLDIVFRLEKKFSTPERPFKIEQGELFPENLMKDPTVVEDGRFTAKGIAMLKERMPHVDFAAFEADPDVQQLSELFTVKSLVDFVQRKLAA
ncbi:MAG TPA: acyl carrier protein [Phycisphaerales bacterium]|nr:acyl carrier protein [Phycisphaerales bacterium]HMP35873.1 acyl carrier protein [Phycisphaerales bacterium]